MAGGRGEGAREPRGRQGRPLALLGTRRRRPHQVHLHGQAPGALQEVHRSGSDSRSVDLHTSVLYPTSDLVSKSEVGYTESCCE